MRHLLLSQENHRGKEVTEKNIEFGPGIDGRNSGARFLFDLSSQKLLVGGWADGGQQEFLRVGGRGEGAG